ncbi:MAG: T9SS type A sorting domain-containing protein, partial [Ignavibacteriaceae bacterium]
VTQTEVFIVRSPIDQNVFFSSSNTLTFNPFFVSEGIYVSTDGGNNWRGNDTCTGQLINFHGGDPGIIIDKDGRFILTRLGTSAIPGLFSHFSTNYGQTWSPQQNITSPQDLERASLATDAVLTSSFYGTTYSTWVSWTIPFSVWFASTDDGAQNWSNPKQINNPSYRCAGGDITIGPTGEVYVCWAGVASVSPFREILVGFGSSSDGGTNWNVQENAFNVNGITGLLASKGNIRVNGLPSIAADTTSGSRRGWIYIVTGQKDLSPAGSDPDIVMNLSTDGGSTWSEGIRVNQDPINNGKTQFFPAIEVDRFGAINIIFYDDRNTTVDSSGVFLARSSDGGISWLEYEISDHNFKPAPIGGLGQGYQGDNIDLTSTDTQIWPVWMDNSSGTYQVWTAPINFSTVSVNDPENNPICFELKQNYPNPFNPSTKIGFQISESGFVMLEVYNILGKKIISLVNEYKSPGYYEVEFNGDNFLNNNILHSGTYFYRVWF